MEPSILVSSATKAPSRLGPAGTVRSTVDDRLATGQGNTPATAACQIRRIVLHADDLGMSRAVTEGIFEAFRHGPLTSTSLLANAPDAARALADWPELLRQQRAGDLPSAPLRRKLDDPARPFDLGIHLNLTEGRPLTARRYPSELLDPQGCFPGLFPLLRRLQRGGSRFRAGILDELSSQVQFILDHGLRPTHLNGHQYIEVFPAISAIIPELLERFHIHAVRVAAEPSLGRLILGRGLGIKRAVLAAGQQFCARRFRRRMVQLAIPHPDAYYGTALSGRLDLRWLRAFLRRPFGLVEICLHPAQPAPGPAGSPADAWHDPLADLRPQELKMLLSADLGEELIARQVKLGRLSQRVSQ
jgi:predicted glycoside hydrolase/deacetylase ChbG (UPF0249 family)